MIRRLPLLGGLLVLLATQAVAVDRSTPLGGPWRFQPDPDEVGDARGFERLDVARDVPEIEERVHVPTRARLEEIVRFFAGKPVLLSEFGAIGVPGVGGPLRSSEDFQAAYLAAVWRAVAAVPDVSGGVVWSWVDYRHRRGFTNDFPAEFGPFGLLTLDRRPKKAYAEMLRLWRAEIASAPASKR